VSNFINEHADRLDQMEVAAHLASLVDLVADRAAEDKLRRSYTEVQSRLKRVEEEMEELRDEWDGINESDEDGEAPEEGDAGDDAEEEEEEDEEDETDAGSGTASQAGDEEAAGTPDKPVAKATPAPQKQKGLSQRGVSFAATPQAKAKSALKRG
jgi:hypothetical protein